ncbi:MAG: putative DNA binding domain-containing protein [Clostridia bacterium]|nr:putative DNA binding domain-containing protein [Clostridia bacterium]
MEDAYNLGKETEQVEFKKSTGELKEGIISICAILNKHQRGDVYFGVRNDGSVQGQDINDSTLRTVSQAIRTSIRPPVYPTITEEKYGAKAVVHVQFEGTQRPYLAYNIPRIRIADEDAVMEQPLYEDMLRQRESVSYAWESQRSRYKISDIDRQVFSDYLKRAKKVGRISFEEDDPASVLTKLELTDGDALLNAGAALFVSSGMNELQMAKFASDEKLTFTDIRRYTGSILDLADKAVQYLVDAMDWRVEFDGGLERREIPEIPVDAIREAVINAFAHRQLESGQSVEIAVYRSFIEIYSPGRFPEGVSPQQFIQEIRKPIRRNPIITRTLYYSKDMESFATGLKRIHDVCGAVRCRVEFYGDEYGFTVRFYRHCGEGWNQGLNVTLEDHDTQDDTQTSLSERILRLIRENKKITREEMSKALSVSVSTIHRTLKRMPGIHYVGSGYSGHWETDEK